MYNSIDTVMSSDDTTSYPVEFLNSLELSGVPSHKLELKNLAAIMYSTSMPVSAPNIVDRQFKKPLFCGPGPCDMWPSVAEALTKPVLSPLCDELFNVFDDIRAGIQYVFQTKSKLVLAISGSGHAGMEAVISNLVGPKETMLIATRGIWDERAYTISQRYGINSIVYRIPFNRSFTFEELETQLRKHRPTALFITHGDSSSGTVQKIEGLGEICHKYGTLLLVDSVVSLGGAPFFMDAWGVDGVYASTQKALSGPAGISPVAFSARAVEKINNRKHEPPFYFDIKLLAQQWNCYGNTKTYHHTISPPLIWALRCCLREICQETLEKSWERHAKVTEYFHKRLQEHSMNFLVPNPDDRLVTVTTVVLPKGYDYSKIINHMLVKHNVRIFAGLGPTAGKSLRIGILGVNATYEVVDSVMKALLDSLQSHTKSLL